MRGPSYSRRERKILKAYLLNPNGKTLDQLATELNRPVGGIKVQFTKLRKKYTFLKSAPKLPRTRRIREVVRQEIPFPPTQSRQIVINANPPRIERTDNGSYKFIFDIVT